MRVKTPRSPLDVTIMEAVNRGTPIDEVLRIALNKLSKERKVKRLAERSGVGYKTLVEFKNSEGRDIMFRNAEDALYALGYRLTLERL